MSLKISGAVVAAALTLSLAGAAHATDVTVSGLYNTGVDAAGTPAANGASELHYTILGGPGARVVNQSNGYPANVWIGDDAVSSWIGPAGFQEVDGSQRVYDYQTSFNLSGADIASFSLTGRWALDDNGFDIKINGISTGQTANWNTWTNFAITSGFVAGVNTIDFVTYNDNTFGPTGVRVEFSNPVVAAASGAPEPAAWALMIAGFGGVGSVLRSRRRLHPA